MFMCEKQNLGTTVMRYNLKNTSVKHQFKIRQVKGEKNVFQRKAGAITFLSFFLIDTHGCTDMIRHQQVGPVPPQATPCASMHTYTHFYRNDLWQMINRHFWRNNLELCLHGSSKHCCYVLKQLTCVNT